MILFTSTMIIILYSNKIFGIITPSFLRNLYSKYDWLEIAYFCIIFITYFLLLLFSMDFSRKFFEGKNVFLFKDEGFSFSIEPKQYIVDKKDIVSINFYKNVTILPATRANPNYYIIIIITEKETYKINTQVIKSMASILSTSKLIEKLKEYYSELKIINNTTFFGTVNKKIRKN